MNWASLIIGAAGLAFAIFAFMKTWKPKRLQYDIRGDQEIVIHSRYTRWADELAIRFGDRDLKQPRVAAVRIINTGKAEAVKEAFDTPLAVSTSEGDEIIAAAITRQQREPEESDEIEPARLSSQEVVAPKVLLNEGEWLEFQLLVEGYEAPVRVHGHAAGFRLTKYAPRKSLSPRTRSRLMIGGSIIALTLFGLLIPAGDTSVSVPNVVGKPIDQAVKQIDDARLNLGTVNFIRGSGKVGIVVSESPEAGKKVDSDSSVNLVVSKGP